MIKYFKGDVISAFETGQYDFLLHQANCFCTFGSGIAKQIREFYPEAYAADLKTQAGDIWKLGTYSEAAVEHGTIVNLYGQFDYGREPGKMYTRPRELEEAIQSLVSDYAAIDWIVCMPKIGSKRGGADWDRDIVPILERQLIEKGWEVHVYEL